MYQKLISEDFGNYEEIHYCYALRSRIVRFRGM